MKMSNYHAYVKLPLHLVILNDDKMGYPCSSEAEINLIKSKSGTNVRSVNKEGVILWISENEFRSNCFDEISVKCVS